MQANWIGKSYGVNFGFPYEIDGESEAAARLHHARRHDHGRDVHARSPPSIRSRRGSRAATPSCGLRRRMQARLGHGSRPRDDGKEAACPTGFFVTHPLSGEHDRGLGRQLRADGLRRRRGDGRAGARRARFRVREEVRPADQARSSTCRASRSAPTPGRSGTPTRKTAVCVNSGKYDGLDYQQAVDAIAADLQREGSGRQAGAMASARLGHLAPALLGHADPAHPLRRCGDVPVPDDQLPVVLPEDLVPDGTGNPLNKHAAFLAMHCPKCGKPARRETDTMDTFVDSSWYFIRFACPEQPARWSTSAPTTGCRSTSTSAASSTRSCTCSTRASGPRSCATSGLVAVDEPFTHLLTQGMVLNHIFQRKSDEGGITYFAPEEVDARARCRRPRHRRARAAPTASRSTTTASARCRSRKRNGVDPQAADRASTAPTPRASSSSSPARRSRRSNGRMPASRARSGSCGGSGRSLRCAESVRANRQRRKGAYAGYALRRGLRKSQPGRGGRAPRDPLDLKQATYDMQRLQFNTVASAAMKMLNALADACQRDAGDRRRAARRLLDPAAGALADHAAHRPRAVGGARLRGRADRRDAGPRSTPPRSSRTRSSSCCR